MTRRGQGHWLRHDDAGTHCGDLVDDAAALSDPQLVVAVETTCGTCSGTRHCCWDDGGQGQRETRRVGEFKSGRSQTLHQHMARSTSRSPLRQNIFSIHQLSSLLQNTIKLRGRLRLNVNRNEQPEQRERREQRRTLHPSQPAVLSSPHILATLPIEEMAGLLTVCTNVLGWCPMRGEKRSLSTGQERQTSGWGSSSLSMAGERIVKGWDVLLEHDISTTTSERIWWVFGGVRTTRRWMLLVKLDELDAACHDEEPAKYSSSSDQHVVLTTPVKPIDTTSRPLRSTEIHCQDVMLGFGSILLTTCNSSALCAVCFALHPNAGGRPSREWDGHLDSPGPTELSGSA